MLDPYRQLLMEMLGNTAAVDAAAHQQSASASGIEYLRQVEDYIQQRYAYYSLPLGEATQPRACAYCGTKHDGSGRCYSCGAPNRV